MFNDSIQPRFDYTFSAWYPHLTKKRKDTFNHLIAIVSDFD